jgi:outer membrane immunogenic protein
MRRLSLAFIVAVSTIALSQIASAADMPVKAPVAPPVIAAAPSWTGWYVGLNAGGNWGRFENSLTVGPGFLVLGCCAFGLGAVAVINNALGGPTDISTSGFTGGIQGGYNWQSGNWLVGGELDFEYSRSAGSNVISGNFFGGTISLASSISSDWLFTARPRLGVIFNNWLFYGTGGLAVTRIKAAWNFFENINPNAESASLSSTKAGWVIGGGIETMLPGKWIIGAEYLYVDFGNVSTTATGTDVGAGAVTNPFTHTVDFKSNIVRARVSKLF